jgi:hypothetical protein
MKSGQVKKGRRGEERRGEREREQERYASIFMVSGSE